MQTLTGVCKYCGQTKVINVPDELDMSIDDIDQQATKECNCPEATHERRKKETYDRAEAVIDSMFPSDDSMNIRYLLKKSAEMIVDGTIAGTKIDDGSRTISIKMTGKGTIKVEKKITRKETREA